MTLKDFFQQRFDARQQGVTDAQGALATARGEHATAQADHAAAVSATAANADALAATRTALAAATTAADADALAATLSEQIVESRKLRAAELDSARDLALAESRAERAAADLRVAERSAAAAEDDLVVATEGQERRGAWSVALTQPPLDTLPADAAALLADAVFSDAEARLADDLPAVLRQRSAERIELQRQTLEAAEAHARHAEDQRDAQEKAAGGVAGSLAEAWTAFLRAEESLGDHVGGAAAALAKARSTLAAIPGSVPLTPEQEAELEDASLLVDRTAAATAEKDRDDAAALVDAKRLEVEERRLEVLAADVDLSAADVDADPAVAVPLGELATLEGALATAEAALDQEPLPGEPTPRQLLDAWEAAAPETTWTSFLAFEQARATLTRLSVAPAPLEADLVAAEDALVLALEADDKSDRTAEVLSAFEAERAAVAAVVRSQQGRRLGSQARGDV